MRATILFLMCVSSSLGSRLGRDSTQAQLDRLAHRLNLLEAENQHLREMLLEDKDKEDVNLGVPSFRTNPEDGETAFVEVSARGMEDPEEDPTIQCQTVCQFVRPNAMSNEIVDEKEESENQDGGLTAEEAEFTGEGMERR